MGDSPMGAGVPHVGAPAPPTSMSKVRIVHLLAAACVIAAPYFGFLPDGLTDQMKRMAPHSAGSMVVNVFWPQGIWLVKRAGGAIAGWCSLGFDTVLGFLVNRVDQLRSSRAGAEELPSAPLPLDETPSSALRRGKGG
ncbi:hypothetical protein ACWDR3_41100 [Streptomyces sp. NPDC001002]